VGIARVASCLPEPDVVSKGEWPITMQLNACPWRVALAKASANNPTSQSQLALLMVMPDNNSNTNIIGVGLQVSNRVRSQTVTLCSLQP
jgi:hypothetical protein